MLLKGSKNIFFGAPRDPRASVVASQRLKRLHPTNLPGATRRSLAKAKGVQATAGHTGGKHKKSIRENSKEPLKKTLRLI